LSTSLLFSARSKKTYKISLIGERGTLQAPKSRNDSLVLGIDYNLYSASTLIDLVEDTLQEALEAIQVGFEYGSRAQLNFLLRAIGGFSHESVYYFE
jgi:hypothetical protein